MSERIEWNIDECMEAISQLNHYGSLIKNAMAGIYNTFRYRISNEWSGHNYNIVVKEVNGCAPEFRKIANYLSITVPSMLQTIVNTQASAGQGTAQTIALESDDDNPDMWEVPESPETADGQTRINIEAVRPFITGSEYPSITAAVDLAKQYYQNYIDVFNQNVSTFKNNRALQEANTHILDFKAKFESRTTQLIEDIIAVAEKGINRIEEADINTRKSAQNATTQINNNGGVQTVSGTAGKATAAGATGFVAAASSGSWLGSTNVSSNGGGSFVDAGAIKTPASTASASTASAYDKTADWNTLSSDDKVKRAYCRINAVRDSDMDDDYANDVYEDYYNKLSTAERERLNKALDGEPAKETWSRVEYNKTADWADLSAEQRAQKALDDVDFRNKLTPDEMSLYSNAQEASGEDVWYPKGEDGGIYNVNPKNLNSAQRVQWAKDVTMDVVGSNPYGSNVQPYLERVRKYMSVEECSKLDSKLRSVYGSRTSNYAWHLNADEQ